MMDKHEGAPALQGGGDRGAGTAHAQEERKSGKWSPPLTGNEHVPVKSCVVLLPLQDLMASYAWAHD
ncbi:hypothetical protein NDU88_001437 [Pleurodeles waltl]|uniref:Uncharacterized protein n=1 Tax=Pleurodeles waltl TaxID=8319 RepID=A0AAV7U8H4_PLEWA|nr:hypothetical protein NDU88_001437 [Pleurodeles waltl]